MNSYQVGFDSQAIVAIFTSLSYELLGCGKKSIILRLLKIRELQINYAK
jgi:hypothetical protein